jgi:hypothetical protein
MSGVLDRMAKRALGALPTVEPRSTPLVVPSAIGFTGAEIAAVGREEVFAEAENSRSNVDNSQRKNPRLPLEASERQSAGSEKSELQPTRESAPRSLSANFAIPEREGSSRNVEARQEANSPSATERSVAKNRSKVEETVEPGGASAQRRTLQAEFAEAEMNNVIGAERSDAPRGPVVTSTIERIVEVEKDSATTDTIATPRSVAMHPQLSERIAARKDASASMLEASAEPKTEIHISIGSIELRAPRTEARPQAAPFRPLVTLEDFLRRKPEGSR